MDFEGVGRSRKGTPQRSLLAALAAGTATCALALALTTAPAAAQDALAERLGGIGAGVPDDAQLFLEADTVVYDSDSQVVTANGGVRIDYGGSRLVARQVVYNQATRRLVANGSVELVQPDGNRIFADTVDITDDFREGFVRALRIETPENTRFAAADAVRENGSVTTFERGVYTACEACRENPERPPLWQVKARRIIWDQQEQVVRYYGAQFEMFGLPLAYLPYFQSPDPTVKRKSGFLAPDFRSGSDTGFGVRVPYFFAIADDKDLTVAGTYYSKQGFLADAEYRQAFENGGFSVTVAGISQRDPDAFGENGPFDIYGNSLNPGDTENRGMIGSTGRFALSDQWTFGWDVLAQSDQNFAATYDIESYDQAQRVSEVYLSGLGERSFFDLRAQAYQLQTENDYDQDIQPEILPLLDYQRIEDVAGGELEANLNLTNLRRDRAQDNRLCVESVFLSDEDNACDAPAGYTGPLYRDDAFRNLGLKGDYTRLSGDVEYRRTYETDFGLLLTPSGSLRGDVYRADMTGGGFDNYGYVGGVLQQVIPGSEFDVNESGTRGMATAALEARYPWLIQTATTSHVIEPIAQLLVRPDEMKAGDLPNEDAQSLVFSTANLFSKDKFSGYDRIEGGTRANLGIAYVGTFGTGYQVDAMFGQSYQLAGENPFAQRDLALTGYDSGLETDRSDYVASLAFTLPVGLTLGTGARFDEKTFEVRRTDTTAAFAYERLAVSATHSIIDAQPDLGSYRDRQQVQTDLSFRVTDNWTAFGGVSYDIENDALFQKRAGIGYADECFSLIVQYEETLDRYQLEPTETTLSFKIGLRTLVDNAGFDYDLDDDG